MPILPEHKEILLSESNSKTLPEWYEFFDSQYTKSQIYSFCHRNGLSVKRIPKGKKSLIQSQNARKYNINQDYLKNGLIIWLIFWDCGLQMVVFMAEKCLILLYIKR